MIDLKKTTIQDFVKKVLSGEIELNFFYSELMPFLKEKNKELMAFEIINEKNVFARIEYLKTHQKEFEKKNKFFGVPIAVKDVINTKELTTEKGSYFWKGYTAGNNARVIDRLEYFGAVMTGKTVTAELAVDHPGKTRNPHNYEYSTGTSSMGSAAAVSAGLVSAALGTQTGSSIIRPASYTGIFGYKPTYGTLPRTGVLKTTDTLDHVGFFANCIDDVILLFDTLRVHGPNYPFCHKLLKERSILKKKIKIGIFSPCYLFENYQEYVKDEFYKLIEKLKKQKNIEIVEIDDDGFFDRSHEIHSVIYDKSLHYYLTRERTQKNVISDTLKKRIEHGAKISINQFHASLNNQADMRVQFDKNFEEFDSILTPSTANIAPKRNNYKEVDDSGLIWSLLGAPSLNVPVFRGPDYMPFGLQTVGVRYSDYKLLEIIRSLIAKDVLVIDVDVNTNTLFH